VSKKKLNARCTALGTKYMHMQIIIPNKICPILYGEELNILSKLISNIFFLSNVWVLFHSFYYII